MPDDPSTGSGQAPSTGSGQDPLDYKREVDEALDRLAGRLRRLLHEAAARLDPFPPFPGAFFTHGIEIEAPGLHSPERGCVVLAPGGGVDGGEGDKGAGFKPEDQFQPPASYLSSKSPLLPPRLRTSRMSPMRMSFWAA